MDKDRMNEQTNKQTKNDHNKGEANLLTIFFLKNGFVLILVSDLEKSESRNVFLF